MKADSDSCAGLRSERGPGLRAPEIFQLLQWGLEASSVDRGLRGVEKMTINASSCSDRKALLGNGTLELLFKHTAIFDSDYAIM